MLLFWKNNTFRKISLAVILVGLNFFIWQKTLQPKSLSVTFLDIKQSDAIFLDLPNKRKMLIDAGKENEVVPQFLKSKGIKNIDVAVITHPHLDHYGGFRNLLDDFKITNLIIATDKPKDTLNKLYTNLIDNIKSKGIRIYYADRGQVIEGLGINVEILSPDASLRRIYNMNALDPNDLSIVLRIDYHNTSFLFPGDLYDAEILKGLPVQSKILKSPHHGSKNANSQLLFSSVKPEYLIISGRKNISRSTIDLINQNRIKSINLRKGGAIVVEVKENKVIFNAFNGEKFISKNIPNQ
jgi:competence protein ComEC